MSCRRPRQIKQKGAGSSDYVQSFHALGADPAELSRFTLQYIDQAPMFHPLQANTMIPTGTTGIIPTGAYYDAMAPNYVPNALAPPTMQTGSGRSGRSGRSDQSKNCLYGGKPRGKSIGHVTQKKVNPWIEHVRQFAKNHGITYGEALRHPKIKVGYQKVSKIK